MKTMRNFQLLLAASALPLIFAACPALAQSQSGTTGQFGTKDTVATDTSPIGSIETVTVTAQKRKQRLIDVPAAISAYSGEELRILNVTNMPQVAQLTPNFAVNYERGKNSTPNFTLRGISGDTLASRLNESSVAVYTDGVFLGDQTGLNGLLFDLERVEVLRGPQGTVFGKNTTGGLVNFISAKPTNQLFGYGNFTYGSDNETEIEGAISGPLSDRIRVRISGRWDRNDGHYVNDYLGAGKNGIPKQLGGTNIWGIRGIVDIDLTDKTLLEIIASYEDNDSQSVPGRSLGVLKPGTTSLPPWTLAQACSPSQVLDGDCIGGTQIAGNPYAFPAPGLPIVGRKPGHGITNLTPKDLYVTGRSPALTAKLTHDFGWAELTSITNYTSNKFGISFDGDFGLTPSVNTGLDIIAEYHNKSHQVSEELRLNGSTKTIDWIIGAFYYGDHKENYQIVNFRSFGFSQRSDGAANTDSYALFAQTDDHLSDQVTLTLGGRFSWERRQLVKASTTAYGSISVPLENVLASLPQDSTNTKSFTGKVALSWMPDSESNYYISYSRGEKSAGFNTGYSPLNTLADNVSLTGPVSPETLDDFEVGAKNQFLDGKLSVNSAAFFYNFQGKQEDTFTFDGLTSQEFYINVGDAQLYGVETEIGYRPDRHWQFNFSGGLLHSKITKSSATATDAFNNVVPLQGKQLERAPVWTFSSIIAYHIPTDDLGEYTIQTEVNGHARESFGITNDPWSWDESHVYVNFRLLWTSPNGNWDASAFVTNAFNERSASRLVDTGVFTGVGALNFAEGEGRLWGVKLGYTFQ